AGVVRVFLELRRPGLRIKAVPFPTSQSKRGPDLPVEVSGMETTKQVSVFLENKPGRLAHVLLALAREKVNVVALTIMDSHEHSVLRLVISDVPSTTQVLQGLNTNYTETDVLMVELRKQPGALAHVC